MRDVVPLDLQQGVNQVRVADTTAHLEPDSVILRDPKTGLKLSILEQNYRADPISAGLLLQLNEGKEIEFFVREPSKPDRIVKGKVIRSGYERYNRGAEASQPVIEVDGKLQFSLPGEPRFPALADDTILKPTLEWRIYTDKAAKLDAELCYVTEGVKWEADYNVIAPEKGDIMGLTGWITIDNQSGKTFQDAKLQLIAGDVARFQGPNAGGAAADPFASGGSATTRVTEKAFDEFHLYSLLLPTTLHDRETKQVEFVRAEAVKAQRIFIYDGAVIYQSSDFGPGTHSIQFGDNFGRLSHSKVRVLREIKNSEANHLGLPLPKGIVRFYRQDEDGHLQFVGEDEIDHTARDETLHLNLGNAFDLVGERKLTDYKYDENAGWIEDTFEIKVRNRKQDESVEIRVIEHLYRWTNWKILDQSDDFKKTDAQTIEFRIPLKPGEERTVTYKVRYSWTMKAAPKMDGDPFGAPAPAPQR